MKIDQLILGAYETNCYILRENDGAKDCVVVDTGLEAGELVGFIEQNELKPAAVILTHGHADHIRGLVALREKFEGVKVYIHTDDAKMLTEAKHNLSPLVGKWFTTEPADCFVEDGDVIDEAGIRLEVFHTPGHTRGGICLYSKDEGKVFTGDTLFADSVGRTDFPGGSMSQLIGGIKAKLMSLADDTDCYPGHGPLTTIGDERAHNQYLQ